MRRAHHRQRPAARSWSGRSSAGRAGCATSSSRCSCCSSCTAGATRRCGRRPRWTRCGRWSRGGYVGRADGEALLRGVPVPAHRRAPAAAAAAAAHPHRARPTPAGAALAGRTRWATAPTPGRDAVEAFRADWVTHAAEVRRLHAKLVYRPLLEAVARVPADGAAADARRRPGSGWRSSASPTRPGRCATSRR